MNYEEFKESVKDHILEYLPESYTDAEVIIHSVVKNNSVHLDGLTVRIPNSNVSPNLNLNQYFRDYEEGRDLDEIMRELAAVRIRSDNAIVLFKLKHDIYKDKNLLDLVNYDYVFKPRHKFCTMPSSITFVYRSGYAKELLS